MAEVHMSAQVRKMIADAFDGIAMDAMDAQDALADARIYSREGHAQDAVPHIERARAYIREIRAKLYESDPRLDEHRAQALALRMRMPGGMLERDGLPPGR